MQRTRLRAGLTAILGAGGLVLLAVVASRAADHIDSPSAIADPTADITDLYAWTTADATKLNLVMNVSPSAGPTATFSEAVAYVVHVASMPSYGSTDTRETQIVCKFYAPQRIECWAGAEYVTGDTSTGSVLTSASQRLRVFAGRRNDPFFFELVGFQETVRKVVAAAPSLTFDANGCPAVDPATSALLVKQLQSSGAITSATDNTKPARDTFAGANVLSLAIQVDKAVVNERGPILGIWASTNRVQ
jgi:Domain of unknown function (DUF4331)